EGRPPHVGAHVAAGRRRPGDDEADLDLGRHEGDAGRHDGHADPRLERPAPEPPQTPGHGGRLFHLRRAGPGHARRATTVTMLKATWAVMAGPSRPERWASTPASTPNITRAGSWSSSKWLSPNTTELMPMASGAGRPRFRR